tara:strand:+ start:65 stop:619 length:555 start_codon:yes stop_codon:yes gene_type:complete
MNTVETEYFKNNWKPDYDKFEYSGWKLLQQFRPKDKILDIGCGYNLFKERLGDRLYGIDPAIAEADEIVSWEDYVPKQEFNVYLALGSLNFGTEEEVEAQIKKLSEICKKGDRIYWRQNPGTGDHPWKGVEQVRFYPWSIGKNYEWADKYGFWVRECKEDTGNRIYAEWFKGNELEYYAYKVQD